MISSYRDSLTPTGLRQANLRAGRAHFHKLCSNCHKLFGEGHLIGPDLTGSNRDNLDYLLENIVDPSRVVPAQLRQSAFLLTDGRIIQGTILRQDSNTVTIQTVQKQETLSRDNIETVRKLDSSLMPDGLIASLKQHEVRDLIAYLQSATQVPRP